MNTLACSYRFIAIN